VFLQEVFGGCQLFFITDMAGNWNEDKAFHFALNPKDSKITEYNFNPALNSQWQGNLMQIRFDPTTQSGDFKIDYIRLEGDVLAKDLSSDEISNPIKDDVSHITKSANEISWEFDTNGPSDGWSFNTHLGNINVKDGYLSAIIVGPKPEMETNGDLKLDTSKIKSIKILYKNSTQSDKAKLYFVTDEFPDWSEERCFEFEINKNDSSATRYIINTLDNPLWKGILKGFKFLPASSGGNINIDYIRMEISE